MSELEDSFVQLILQFGFVLNNGEETWNVLHTDQRIFQSNIRSFIKTEPESNIKKFKNSIETYLDDEMNFLIALLPTRNNPDLVVSHSSNQDSFLKLIMEINELQSDLFDYLIDKLLNYCENLNNDPKSNEQTIMNVQIDVATYIINHFRYQPRVFDSDSLCKKLIELINSINSNAIKKVNYFLFLIIFKFFFYFVYE
jgi:hypothetical protein